MRFLSAVGAALAVATAMMLTPVGAAPAVPAQPTWSLGFKVLDATAESFWRAHMRTQDQALGFTNLVTFLVGAVPGTRVVATPTVTLVSATISVARQNGLAWVGLNDETTGNCATLAANEATAARLVHAAGMRLLYMPMGVGTLDRCYPTTPQLVTQADRVVFQAQAWQDFDPNFVSDIHSVVSGLRAQAPSHQVWVQLSANPPHNPTISAAELISQIQSVQDGSSGQADGINIFYFPSTQSTMEQAVLAFLP